MALFGAQTYSVDILNGTIKGRQPDLGSDLSQRPVGDGMRIAVLLIT